MAIVAFDRQAQIMRVAMTGLALQAGEVKVDLFRFAGCRLVARIAGDRGVRAFQCKARLTMHRQRVGGGSERFHRVALATFSSGRGAAQLAIMCVFVAVETTPVLWMIVDVHALARMAFGAIHTTVHSKQRIARFLMMLQVESGWCVSVHRMATTAVALVGAGRELVAVLVLVAIETGGVRDLGAEVFVFMTVATLQRRVLASKVEG